MDQSRNMKFGSKYVWRDFYTYSSFQVLKFHGLGPRDTISKFLDPLVTFERIELSASSLVH